MRNFRFITILKSQNRAMEERIYFEDTGGVPSERELGEAIMTLCKVIGTGIRWDPRECDSDARWQPTDSAFRFESGGRAYWFQPSQEQAAAPSMSEAKQA